MTTHKHPDSSYAEQVRRKAERIVRARRRGDSFWSQLVHVGVLGWMFVLPVIVAAFLGGIVARETGIRPLAVGFIIAGVLVGAYVVARQLKRSVADDDESEEAKP